MTDDRKRYSAERRPNSAVVVEPLRAFAAAPRSWLRRTVPINATNNSDESSLFALQIRSRAERIANAQNGSHRGCCA